jgi:hypothetical protein
MANKILARHQSTTLYLLLLLAAQSAAFRIVSANVHWTKVNDSGSMEYMQLSLLCEIGGQDAIDHLGNST